MTLRVAVALLCLTGLSASGPAWAASTRILFVGNSLTYANDLPRVVASLARSAGHPTVVESVARPDFSLEDHWRDGEARRAIARGGWTVVVLQQGPSALPESRRLLVDYVKRFDREITAVGARTAVYMVWPSAARRGDFGRVSASYRAAASAVGGLLLPVADAWREAWSADARLALYGPDGFHPSPMGTYLASLVIHTQVFGEAPPASPVAGATAEEATLLRQAAARATAAPSPR